MKPEIPSQDKSLVYIRKSEYTPRSRNLKPDKRIQAEVKLVHRPKSKDEESEITEDVEEISPRKFSELNTRSKKITKRR